MDRLIKKIVWLVIAAPAVYLAIVWNQLPEKVALHSNLKGEIDRYGDRSELVTMTAIMIAINALVYLIVVNIYRIDPKKYAAENRERLQKIAISVVAFMSAILCVIIYSSMTGNMKFSSSLILAGVGVLFSIIGNYLPNLKPNYFAGLRLPWTLENPENWRKTHALAGKMWFIGGIIIAIVCILTPPVFAFSFFFSVMLIITIIPSVYSYKMYRRQKRTI